MGGGGGGGVTPPHIPPGRDVPARAISLVKIVEKLIKYLYMAEGSRDGNRYEKQNGEPNDIIRQLFSRIGELSDAISGRPNQVDTESEVRRTFTGNGYANRERNANPSGQSTSRPTAGPSASRPANRYIYIYINI